jgi:hypothetical protein
MYIVGGCYGDYTPHASIVEIDLEEFLATGDASCLKQKEIPVSNKDLIARWGHVSLVKGEKLYIIGGRSGQKDL